MVEKICQTITFLAEPRLIYDALLDSNQFGEITGTPAKIGSGEGESFSCFDGRILGRHIELVPDKLIVQAWRASNWAPGIYSIVKFELKPDGNSTILDFEHVGFPETETDHLESGWVMMYWNPLKQYLEG